MSEPGHGEAGHGGAEGHGGGLKLGGHKFSPKILLLVAGVVVVLLFMARSKSAASANSTGPSTDSALSNSEAAMLSQLQQDASQQIADELSSLPAAPAGPRGPAGPPGPAGGVPPHTVHQPPPHTGSGVPAAHGYFYTVHGGDSLSAIASAKHVSGGFRSLLNPKTDAAVRAHPNLIHPGDRVWIPT